MPFINVWSGLVSTHLQHSLPKMLNLYLKSKISHTDHIFNVYFLVIFLFLFMSYISLLLGYNFTCRMMKLYTFRQLALYLSHVLEILFQSLAFLLIICNLHFSFRNLFLACKSKIIPSSLFSVN